MELAATPARRPPAQGRGPRLRTRWPAVVLAGALLSLPQTLPGQESFPHAAHAGLFPLCTGCHDGVLTGDRSLRYPAAGLCARCHDGRRERRVAWTPPAGATAAPWFDHAAHARHAGRRAFDCDDCHRGAGGERMRVQRLVVADACAGCHPAHHRADGRCRACHAAPPDGAHDLRSHLGCSGSGCHDAPFTGVLGSREFCLVCHRDRASHEPGGICGDCHRVS